VEYLVHVDIAVHPKQLRMVTLGIPSDAPIETLEPGSLPKHWNAHPAPARLAAIGTSWARSARSLVLAVPSAVIPGEENLILNPAHADMARVRIVEIAPFAFDPRLLRGRS
jgi:RES domain-containing protein